MKTAVAILIIAWFFAAIGVLARTDLTVDWEEIGLAVLFLPLWGGLLIIMVVASAFLVALTTAMIGYPLVGAFKKIVKPKN